MEFRMLIDGEMMDSAHHTEVINPVDETVAAHVPAADAAMVDRAVAAAARAWTAWRQTDFATRRAAVLSISAAIAEHAEELAALLVLETGRPIGVAQFEVGLARQFADYYAEQSLEPETLFDDATRRVELHRKPLGVVAAISPWNAPLYLSVNKIAPALIAGNTVVLKPPPTAPLTTLRFGEIMAARLPAGVLNIVSGGAEAGARLVAHPDVAKIAFTGSTQTGRAIMAAAAPGLKRITLELGGNDAAIVLPDADPKAIAPALFGLAFFNSGQVCAVIKRLYVHESLYEEVCSTIAAYAEGAVMGDGANAGTQFGPIQNRAQYEKVRGFLEDARLHGNVLVGGVARSGPGYFVPLTVVRDISDGTATVDEEAFGPVLPIIRYSDVDEVVSRVNRSAYGLGASVWSSDVAAATAVAVRLETGTVWINQHCALDPAIPFPTHKQSGLGVESGREGLYAYTSLQVVNISHPGGAA